MAKLISKQLHRANMEVSLAIVGVVVFDDKCEADIDDQLAEQLEAYLVDKDSLGYEIILSSDAPKVKTPAKPKVAATEEVEEEEEGDEGDDAGNTDPGSDTILAGMDLDALRQMASESGFPKEEWEKKNTKALKKYLTEKLA